MNKSPTVYYDKELIIKRKDWDSNPGSGYPLTAFRVRIIQFDYQFVTTETVNT